VEGTDHGLLLKYYPSRCLNRLRKTMKTLTHDSQSLKINVKVKKKKERKKRYPCNGLWRSIGLSDVEAPIFLDSQLTDDSDVVSLMHRPPFYPL
jgi:hypothetical protein